MTTMVAVVGVTLSICHPAIHCMQVAPDTCVAAMTICNLRLMTTVEHTQAVFHCEAIVECIAIDISGSGKVVK